MMKLFNKFKQHIIRNPKVVEYRPTSEKYDGKKLIEIMEQLDYAEIACPPEEREKVMDFIFVSNLLNKVIKDFYLEVEERLKNFNMKGVDIVDYFIAILNSDYKAVTEKMKAAYGKMSQGLYMLQDITNLKLELPDKSMVDMKSVMEGATDATSLLCNYLRHHLNDDYKNERADPKSFVSTVVDLYQMADYLAPFKQSYDFVLYDNSFVKIYPESQTILFDDENYKDEKLKALGHMILGERIIHMRCQNYERGRKSELEHYMTNYRVKRTKVIEGYVTIEFGQGNAKRYQEFVRMMQAAIDAYYEYLDLNITLKDMNGIKLAEALAVWVALQYICFETSELWRMEPKMIFTKEEMDEIPRKIKILDLEVYLVKLTGINLSQVKRVMKALEVDWKRYNSIWKSPLYKIKDYYCVPFIPIVNCQPYYIIENIMQQGGYNINKRGKDFEKYVYNKIVEVGCEYNLTCISSKQFGTKGEKEEIDLMLGLRDIIVLAEAKCIHYSMEPQNYRDAWERLSLGAEQALRKKTFVEEHPEFFIELGDVSKKSIVPVVLTNYPLYAGLEHEGVYIIDSHTFISYFAAGYMSMRMMSEKVSPIMDTQFFYTNETEMSANFERYVREQPIKQMHLEKMTVEEIPLLSLIKPWKCKTKTAVYNGNPDLNILRGIDSNYT